MIAADAPILFCKACESVYPFIRRKRFHMKRKRCQARWSCCVSPPHVSFLKSPFPGPSSALVPRHLTPFVIADGPYHAVFISEITARAFIIADSNKRRTLSRADIAKALAKSDQFDFLIDIVPREEGLTGLSHATAGGAIAGGNNLVAGVSPFSFVLDLTYDDVHAQPSQPTIHQEQDRPSTGGQGSVSSSSTAVLDQASTFSSRIVVIGLTSLWSTSSFTD